MQISIIIPTLNEQENIGCLIAYLKKYGENNISDLIVVDGGSEDDTCKVAKAAGAEIYVASVKGRAPQMNYGASRAKGTLLYFLHADTLPPPSFATDIIAAVSEGYLIGCYRFKFNSDKLLLKINAFFTRFDRIMCRGGDQSLFITRQLFDQLNGFDKNLMIMEDYDIIQRARKIHEFKIMPKDMLVSARKYNHNNFFMVNMANFIIFMMYFLGFSQPAMVKTYKKMLDYR